MCKPVDEKPESYALEVYVRQVPTLDNQVDYMKNCFSGACLCRFKPNMTNTSYTSMTTAF
jgi:hypothetical protein